MSEVTTKPLISVYKFGSLLFMKSVTPLHAGVGRAGGVVDLPVQRDLYGYPIIYASSLKGALKSLCLRLRNRNDCIKLFGSTPEEVPTQPGTTTLLDAQLLLIPVRLLRGVYGYVTSPLLLRRFADYIEILSSDLGSELRKIIHSLSSILEGGNKVVTIDPSKLVVGEPEKVIIINEEFWLTPVSSEGVGKIVRSIINLLPSDMLKSLDLSDRPEKLLIVSDSENISLQIVEKSLLRLQRVRLKEGEKVVEAGALWSEEYIPQDTVFYTLALHTDERSSAVFSEMINQQSKGYLVLGGNETIGKGLTKVYVR